MQEEIEHKTVNFAISTTKLTARTFLKGAQFLLRQYDKNASQGKQSMKRLIRQNRGVTNVEIEKTGILLFYMICLSYAYPLCYASISITFLLSNTNLLSLWLYMKVLVCLSSKCRSIYPPTNIRIRTMRLPT